MGTTEILARHIVETTYDALPAGVVRAAKDVILDGVGVMLAGSQEEPPRIVAEYVREMGGAPRCTVFGHGFKTSPPMAAFVNGVSGHVLDFEPMWHPATHATSPTLPSILALAETRDVTGRDAITALAVAFEVQGRLRLGGFATEEMARIGFHPPGTVGPLGAAAAGAVLLGLDVQQTRWALGLAASRSGTLAANIGSMTKSSHCGNAGRMGLEAALLAAKGFTASEDVIEAPAGWARLFHPEGFDFTAAEAFGRPWRMVDPGLATKKYPSQYGTHRGIDAALELRRTHGLDPAGIAGVLIRGPVMPYIDRPFPRTGLEGKFSYQYTVAAALLDGGIEIDTFRDARRFAPEMEALLRKVELRMDPAIPGDLENMWVEVTVRTAAGRTLTARCDRPRGIWGNPLTPDERLAKFRATAGVLLAAPQVERAQALIESLETLPTLRDLIEVLHAKEA
ncbi:MAG: MmgE/PrpD family protein [Candidatus Rokubacteria bacterium]|nr:MmgE/PrpD family protein [Candidatus Rokubacteria bacterium]